MPRVGRGYGARVCEGIGAHRGPSRQAERAPLSVQAVVEWVVWSSEGDLGCGAAAKRRGFLPEQAECDRMGARKDKRTAQLKLNVGLRGRATQYVLAAYP